MIAALAALVAGGCSKQDDTLEETQRTSFTNYLKGQQYAYAFSSGSSGKGELYYTNRKDLIDEESLTDLEHYWPFEPQEISLSDSRLVKGVRLGLDGCRQGDSVQLFLVSRLGYGNKPLGLVPANTPLVWDIVVNQVVK